MQHYFSFDVSGVNGKKRSFDGHTYCNSALLQLTVKLELVQKQFAPLKLFDFCDYIFVKLKN